MSLGKKSANQAAYKSKPDRVDKASLVLTLFYTRGLEIVVSHVMVPLPYRVSLGFFT
jgi:hypothetical protein